MTAPLDFRQEQRRVAIAMAGAAATSVAALAVAVLLSSRAADLPFASRLQDAMRIDLVVVVWLAAAIANVARLRFVSERDIAGSGAEPESDEIRRARAVLQNTLEQVCLAVATHLIVAATFRRSTILIAALAGLFAIGRLLFWAGYRQGASGRAFGFALTFYPQLLALAASAVVLLLGWTA